MEPIELAKTIARESGKTMLERFRKTHEISWKQAHQSVTETDKIINHKVIERIKAEFPTQDIYGEEESSRNGSEYVWVCDPIDGTLPFSRNIPIFAFMLALIHKGQPILGVIYDPVLDRMYTAEKGKGAYLNGKKIHVSEKADFQKALLGHTTWKSAQKDLTPAYARLVHEGADVFRLGAIGYQAMLVASGEMDAAFTPGMGAYDAAAPKIIVEEAGGKFTDLNGNDQPYDGKPIKGFIASNGKLHEAIVRIINETNV
jgi:myo-inositol-1(or 4)-monophosphatase